MEHRRIVNILQAPREFYWRAFHASYIVLNRFSRFSYSNRKIPSLLGIGYALYSFIYSHVFRL